MQATQKTQYIGPVQVLDKIVTILDLLARNGDMTVSDLVAATGEPKTTVYRLLSALQGHGLVEPGESARAHRLGFRLFRLGSTVVARLDIRKLALPVMQDLHDQTGETVFLCVRRGNEAVCVERIEGRWVLLMALPVGGALPLHIGAAPRALLAYLSDEEIEEYFRTQELTPFTEKSPTNSAAIKAILREIRLTGVSVTNEEIVPAMAGVGAPIFDHLGVLQASISLGGPHPTILGDNEASSRGRILQAAMAISRTLGHDLSRYGVNPKAL